MPINLYHKPSVLRDWLTYYNPGEEPEQAEYKDQIGLILARYMLEHGAALMDRVGGFDSVLCHQLSGLDPTAWQICTTSMSGAPAHPWSGFSDEGQVRLDTG